MKLDRNFYLVHNTVSDTVTHYDDALRLINWLIGKKTSHLIIHVINGDKAKLLVVDATVELMQRKLIETMNSL